jgi:hypothetical protein
VNRGPNLTLRLWDVRDGDPGEPERVLGIPVDRLLARRADAPGALVVLEDRRLALTGPLAAVGLPRFLREYVRQRARSKRDQAYRTWLAEVSVVLDRMRPEARGRSATKG